MLINNSEPDDVEIIIGLVAPIGTNLDRFVSELQAELSAAGYTSSEMRLSKLLDETTRGGNENDLPSERSPKYFDARMTAGDDLRRQFDSGDALAAYAIARIRSRRREDTGDERDQERRHAWIIRTLKHPEEIKLFRVSYGRRFILFGVSSPKEEREGFLTELICNQQSTFDRSTARTDAHILIARDEQDPQDNTFGQAVRDTFSKADAFIEVRKGTSCHQDAKRLIGLLFGQPFITPTRTEHSMFLAWAASLRSSAFGRQVGAALTTAGGDLISTGTNEVPKPGGGEYWEGDVPDHRDFVHQSDFNTQTLLQVVANVFDALNTSHWLADAHSKTQPSDLARTSLAKDGDDPGPLSKSRIRDIIEFGRITHAEMSAISSAARRGASTQGAVLYTTTYPCHMCGRMIINAGISIVHYIDPYPKSMVPAMYGDLISEASSNSNGRVQFQRFVGIAPQLYATVFAEINRTRDEDGRAQAHPREKLRFRPSRGESMASANFVEAAIVLELDHRITKVESIRAEARGETPATSARPEWLNEVIKNARAEVEGAPATSLPTWARNEHKDPSDDAIRVTP